MTNFSRRNIHGERDVTIDKHVHASRKGRQPESMGRTCLRMRRRRGGSLSL